jgi:hypothetical protein
VVLLDFTDDLVFLLEGHPLGFAFGATLWHFVLLVLVPRIVRFRERLTVVCSWALRIDPEAAASVLHGSTVLWQLQVRHWKPAAWLLA